MKTEVKEIKNMLNGARLIITNKSNTGSIQMFETAMYNQRKRYEEYLEKKKAEKAKTA